MDGIKLSGGKGAFAIYGLAQSAEYSPQKLRAHLHFQHSACGDYIRARGDAVHLPKGHQEDFALPKADNFGSHPLACLGFNEADFSDPHPGAFACDHKSYDLYHFAVEADGFNPLQLAQISAEVGSGQGSSPPL